MRIKIQNGTGPGGDDSLCHTCRRGTVVKGARLHEEIIECSALDRNNRITFTVKSCSSYLNRNHPSINDMEEIAWILRTDAKRKTVGFIRSSDLPIKDRYVLNED